MKKKLYQDRRRIILKIKVLEYFITLAESQSINEAAGSCISPSPASQKLCSCLRRRSALSCFKEKNGIQLTEAGKRILPEAKQMVEYYNGWLSLSEKLPCAP